MLPTPEHNQMSENALPYCDCVIRNKANASVTNKLQSTIYQIWKLITGLNGNPARKALEVELGLLPLHLRHKKLAVKFLTKTAVSINNPLIPKIQLLCKSLHKLPTLYRLKIPFYVSLWQELNTFHLLRMPVHPIYCYSWLDHFFTYRVDLHSFTKGDSLSKLQFEYYLQNLVKYNNNNLIDIYTDGSKTPDNVGAAFFIPAHQVKCAFKLPTTMTIYTAECIAIRQALLYIKNKDWENIAIFSDSYSVLRHIATPGPSINEDWYLTTIKYQLRALTASGKNVTLVWIPSHSGIKHNDYVDCLAKNTVRSQQNTTFAIPLRDFIFHYNTDIKGEWQQDWLLYRSKLHSPLSQLKLSVKDTLWFSKNFTSKQAVTLIFRLRLGTAQTPQYLHKIHKALSPNCECGDYGDINHILFGCKLNSASVDLLFNDIYKTQPRCGPINISYFIDNPRKKVVEALFRHVTRCKMKL